MICDGKGYIRSLLQRSTRGSGSEEHLVEQLCALSFSMLQTRTVKNVSVYISRRSPVSTLSCVPDGGVKSS